MTNLQRKPLELYIHVPFCARKCLYCDFLSFRALASVHEAYTEQLIREIEVQGACCREYQVKTVFIGGGTPSVMEPCLIRDIMQALNRNFDIAGDAEITREGKGDLFRQFEKLRNELEEMGMFDSCYKQPIPKYARKVGIVTAGTGAAIRDIMNISARRNPYVQLILYPALVQGEQAKYSIAKGIETLDRMGLDVLIVGRGGGSIEDLWAFNEEMVARAIFNCTTPVISAVGHETDVTIADYVADLRAPTPSAAAELAVFDYGQFVEQVNLYRQVLERSMERRLEKLHFRLDQCGMRLKLLSPEKQLNDRRQRLADMESRLERMMEENLGLSRRKLEDRRRRLEARMALGLTEGKHRLALLSGRLDGLSPLKKLGGGFGFVTDARGRAFTSITQAEPGDIIRVSVKDGRVDARVVETESMKLPGSEG